MELIDKIKELFKPILDFDDLCEIEWGKQDLCREILNLIEDHEPEQPKTPTEIATKYVKGQHDALTDNQEIKDLAREIEEYKNQPPKVRPMSELPESENMPFHAVFVFQSETGKNHFEAAYSIKGDYVNVRSAIYLRKNKWKIENLKIIGWLYELPNPNKIEL